MNEDDTLEKGLISKSQRKREADAMQALGRTLTRLTASQLQELALEEKVLEAINEFQRLPNSHGAKRRQLQFIGKIMRDSDVDAIESRLNKLLSPNFQSDKNKRKKEIEEQARDILKNGDNAISKVLIAYPDLDRQQLRQLSREFQRANETKKIVLQRKIQELLQAHTAA